MTDLPWARMRLIDPVVMGLEAQTCQDCTREAVLHFQAEYRVAGVRIGTDTTAVPDLLAEVLAGEEVAVGRVRDAYACLEHAGKLALGVAYTAALGPSGAV
ncbi:hypothetical protein ACFXPI_11080 [Streptomyces sp. NPDC059104]|uniref:hypothetical protein n=1 Tax=Streptomyces sp. NPDC059104 TaxID=3346729 RepID=UPI0036BE25C6